MQDNQQDRELQLQFRKLREQVDLRAPPFSVPEPTARRTRFHLLRPVPVFAMAAAVAAVALGVGLRTTHRSLPPGFDAVLWRGQTDFLLVLPGQDLLNTVPRVDLVPDLDVPGLSDDAGSRPLG